MSDNILGSDPGEKIWRVKTEFTHAKVREISKQWKPKDYPILPLRYGQRLKVLQEQKHPGWSVGQFIDSDDEPVEKPDGSPLEGFFPNDFASTSSGEEYEKQIEELEDENSKLHDRCLEMEGAATSTRKQLERANSTIQTREAQIEQLQSDLQYRDSIRVEEYDQQKFSDVSALKQQLLDTQKQMQKQIYRNTELQNIIDDRDKELAGKAYNEEQLVTKLETISREVTEVVPAVNELESPTLANLRAKETELQSTVTLQQSEIDTQKRRIEELTRNMSDASVLQQQLSEHRDLAKASNQELEQSRTRITELEHQLESSQQDSMAKFSQQDSLVEQTQNDIKNLEMVLQKKEEIIASSGQAINVKEKELKVSLETNNQLQASLTEASTQLDNHRQQLEKEKSITSTLNEKLASAQATNAQLTTQYTQEKDQLVAQIADLTSSNTNLLQEKTNLTVTNQQQSTQISQLKEQVLVDMQKVSTLEEESQAIITKLDSQVKDRDTTIETKNTKIAELESQLASSSKSYTDVQEKLSQTDHLLATRSQEVVDLNSKLAATTTSLTAVQLLTNSLERDKQTLQKDLTTLEKLLTESQSELMTARNGHEVACRDMEVLRSKLNREISSLKDNVLEANLQKKQMAEAAALQTDQHNLTVQNLNEKLRMQKETTMDFKETVSGQRIYIF